MDYPALRVKHSGTVIGILLAGNLLAAVVKPPVQMVTNGFPSLPVALAKKAKPYLSARALRLQDWHPVQKHILITQCPKGGQVAQLHVLEKAGGKLKQLTRGPKPVRSALYQPVDGRSLIFTRDEGGGEQHQIFHYDLAASKTTRLTDGKNHHTGAHWSPDGKRIAYFSSKRNGRDNDLYVADPTRPGSEKLLAKLRGGGWGLSDWSADGELMILIEHISITNGQLHIVDARTGVRSRFSQELSVEVSYRNARFDPKLRAVYYTCDEDSDFQHIIRLDLKTGDRKRYLGGVEWDVEAFELSPDGATLAVVHNAAGSSNLNFIQAATGEPAAQFALNLKLADGVIRSLKWHRSSAELVYDFDWALTPGIIRSIHAGQNKLTNWAASDTGELDLNRISIPGVRELRSNDRLKFDSVIYLPGKSVNGKFIPQNSARPRPVIILFHGGPESQFRPRFMGRLNYFMSEQGIALICPNVRGSSGYGKKFLRADNGTARAKVMRDIQQLREAIAANPKFDAKRIAVMGSSYGGFMALHSMVEMNSFIQCGVNVVGISNFVTFLKNTSDLQRDLRRVEYGDERDPKMRKFLEDISPLTHVGKITRAMLIVQGANDPRVPAIESAQMEATLRAKGQTVWSLLAKDEGHGFRKQANRDYQFLATIEFLRRHLLEAE